MKKVLLSTVIKPFGLDNINVQAELFHAQVTKAQGIFSMRSVYNGWGLEFIANNLLSPTTVMHYPSEANFSRELKKGYDFVGISFVMSTWHKAEKMIKIIRELSPKTKIVLGSYGTVMENLEDYADYVCRGEGLQFMQELLGEKPLETYNTPIVINELKCVSLPIGKTGVLFAGLGCPNGCDFCCTSHYFKTKHIPLLKTGREIYEAMVKYDPYLPSRSYSIIDEDFLKDTKRVRELYDFIVNEEGRPRTITCFASAKSIRQYEPEWLAELGISTIWIGVESKLSTYEKTRGLDIDDLFRSLHNVGINTLGSMIIGVDAHTPENIWEDIDHHISLNPSLSQFIIYSPCPTTPLWDRLKKEKVLNENYPLENRDGFHLLFDHKNFSAEQIETIQQQAFEKDYHELGPSVIRYVEKSLNGYRHFSLGLKPIHAARRKEAAETLMNALPLFSAAIIYAPSSEAREKARRLRREIFAELGLGRSIKGIASAAAVHGLAAFTKISQSNPRIDLQPKTTVTRYNYKKTKQFAAAPMLKNKRIIPSPV